MQNTGALAELRHAVDKYRQFGHLDANWDPLKLWKRKCVGGNCVAIFVVESQCYLISPCCRTAPLAGAPTAS